MCIHIVIFNDDHSKSTRKMRAAETEQATCVCMHKVYDNSFRYSSSTYFRRSSAERRVISYRRGYARAYRVRNTAYAPLGGNTRNVQPKRWTLNDPYISGQSDRFLPFWHGFFFLFFFPERMLPGGMNFGRHCFEDV